MCVPERLLPLVGWWCWCVGGVLPGALPPFKVGVLVVWCVGVHVCVFLMGCCPLWFGGVGVGGVMPGAMHPLWFGGVWCWIWLLITIHKYSKIFEHVQNAKLIGNQLACAEQRANTTVCLWCVAWGLAPLWFGVWVSWWFVS